MDSDAATHIFKEEVLYMPGKGRGAIFALLAAGLLLGACTGMDRSFGLTETDRQPMDEAVQRSLEADKLGQSRNWSNPESGHVGTVIPIRTFMNSAGRPCRDYQQTVTIGGETRLAYDTACRQPAGGWHSVNFGGPAGFNSYHPPYRATEYPYGHHYQGYPYDRFDHYHDRFNYGLGRYRSGHGFSLGYGHSF